ncbi:hypothetical protein VOLCADRAFT_104920 [Volvox carteri f. nagariensis]|uniref:F-box domain-containing protein n=1 Tax=Volvox carteri f. nagariensis TaxID=3068 RepID=D8TX28_VOLCA|nr:uncharacterized protein VOLCADRAFT_104920 [Volvox carteri f. nagariensis]EFJ47838.1 hypothetical protein VOLCADRAFT_104920 [Volvox carteri f. nagariensis]|eukprot:XP_002950944.1 hypothetical protein VOLCADRAFT_104920 [Volvox carteri f. nagariensis]
MSTICLEQLPTDALTQVCNRLSPSSRLMLRQTCRWACRISDETCLRLGGVAETDIRSMVTSTLGNNDYGGRFRNIHYLHMCLSGTCDRHQNGAPAAIANKESRPGWPVLLSQLRFLRGVNLTSCKQFTQEQFQQLAASCPALVMLHVHRDANPNCNSVDITQKRPSSGQLFLGAAHPDRGSRGGDGLMCRPTVSEPWALLGLTFAPLAACTKLRELKLYDTPPLLVNSFDRPTGLPGGALLSLGCLTQLQSLALAGVAAGLDLCHCISRLTGLTRLELALLPACCESGSARWRRPRQQQPKLMATAADVLGPRDDEVTLPRELYDMVLSANLSSLETLQLDLPQPPLPAAAAASGGAAASSRPVSLLAPMTLACSPEHLEALMTCGMSLRRLQALHLRGWVPWGISGRCRRPMGRLPYGQGVVPGVVPYSHHLSELLIRWAFHRVATSINGPESGGGGGGGGVNDHGDDGDLLPRDVRGQLAAGRLPLGRAVRHAAWDSTAAPPRARLPACLRLRVSILEEEPTALFPEHQGTAAAAAAVAITSRNGGSSKCYAYLQSAASHVDLDLLLPPPIGATPDHWVADPPEIGSTPGPADPHLLAMAVRAAGGSRLAAPLRWLPYQLPNLYGLRLAYNAVDERAVALLAAGLPALRRLALGRVELSAGGRGGLMSRASPHAVVLSAFVQPLGSLQHLSELRFGQITIHQQNQQQQTQRQQTQAKHRPHQEEQQHQEAPSTPMVAATLATTSTTMIRMGARIAFIGDNTGAEAQGMAGGGAPATAATATSATTIADPETSVAGVLRELEDCCLAFSLPAALKTQRRFWPPSYSSSLPHAAAAAARAGGDPACGSTASGSTAPAAGAALSSAAPVPLAVMGAGTQVHLGTQLVVVVPPQAVSLEHAVVASDANGLRRRLHHVRCCTTCLLSCRTCTIVTVVICVNC